MKIRDYSREITLEGIKDIPLSIEDAAETLRLEHMLFVIKHGDAIGELDFRYMYKDSIKFRLSLDNEGGYTENVYELEAEDFLSAIKEALVLATKFYKSSYKAP